MWYNTILSGFYLPVIHLVIFWRVVPLILAHQSSSSIPFLQQESAKCVFVLHGHITAVKSLSFCSSGLALVSGGIGGLLNIWSLQVRKSIYWCCHVLIWHQYKYHLINNQQYQTIELLCILLLYKSVGSLISFSSCRMVQSLRLLQVWVQSSVLPGYQTWV